MLIVKQMQKKKFKLLLYINIVAKWMVAAQTSSKLKGLYVNIHEIHVMYVALVYVHPSSVQSIWEREGEKKWENWQYEFL